MYTTYIAGLLVRVRLYHVLPCGDWRISAMVERFRNITVLYYSFAVQGYRQQVHISDYLANMVLSYSGYQAIRVLPYYITCIHTAETYMHSTVPFGAARERLGMVPEHRRHFAISIGGRCYLKDGRDSHQESKLETIKRLSALAECPRPDCKLLWAGPKRVSLYIDKRRQQRIQYVFRSIQVHIAVCKGEW